MAMPVATTRVVHAVCSHDCPDSCAVLVTVESITAADGTVSERAVKVAGDPSHPVTQGFLCAKVAQYLDRVYSPDRLLYPMRRKPGATKGPAGYGSIKGREADAFERINWDQALDLIAQKLITIAAEFGPESVLPYSYAGTIGQLGFGSMDRRFFHRLGASRSTAPFVPAPAQSGQSTNLRRTAQVHCPVQSVPMSGRPSRCPLLCRFSDIHGK